MAKPPSKKNVAPGRLGLTVAAGTWLVGALLWVTIGWQAPLFAALFLFGPFLRAVMRQWRSDPANMRGTWREFAASAAGFAVGGALLGAAAFGLYASLFARRNATCGDAERAATVGRREALVARSYEYAWVARRLGKATLLTGCPRVESELEALGRRGECPHFPPRDARCDCGDEAWPRTLDCDEGTLPACETGALRCAR
jgi:hypothetical protein